LVISNVSFPKVLEEEISSGGKSSKFMIPYIVESMKQLEKAGADFIVLPCNTLHAILPILKEKSELEVIDLIEEVSKNIRKSRFRKVGILSTTGTRNEKLYDKSLENVELIYPTEEEQKKVLEIIVKIIRKIDSPEDKNYLENLILRLIKRGAEKVILACTDLANLVNRNENILDSTEILIESIKEKMN